MVDLVDRYAASGFECVCGNMRMAARAVTSIYNRHLRRAGVQATQMAVLWAVVALRSATVKEVADRIVMDQTTLLRNLRILARRGLVSMTVGEDRRQRIVEVTPAGRELFAVALPHWQKAQQEVQQSLGRGGLEAMNRTLLKLVSAIP
jgi:DNA-binding MarR family transcriptional regulator